LGKPTSEETTCPDGKGRYRHYKNGSIYWHPTTGAYELHGFIHDKWGSFGWERSAQGYPVTDETTTPDGKGKFNHFQNGSIYYHPDIGGTFGLIGRIREAWAKYNWEKGFLGYPMSNQKWALKNLTTGKVVFWNEFQGGWISVDDETGELSIYKKATSSSPNYEITIYAVQVADNNGKNITPISSQEVQMWVDWANRVYSIAGIKFIYDGNLELLNNTKVNGVTGEKYNNWEDVKTKLNNMADKKGLLVVFRGGPNGEGLGGFSSTTYNFVVMPNFKTSVCNVQNIGCLAHEIGHYLGLPHTFAKEFQTTMEAMNFYLNNSEDPNCFDGDCGVVDDTLPDPFIREIDCDTSIDTVKFAGVTFPLGRGNIMSYYHCTLPPSLSLQQVKVVREAVINRKKTHGLIVKEVTISPPWLGFY
jgi:hypothetical protein